MVSQLTWARIAHYRVAWVAVRTKIITLTKILGILCNVIVFTFCPNSIAAGIETNAVVSSGSVNGTIETIVCVRHGEKQPDNGQLTDRGLDRALALPGVLQKKHLVPQFCFAPNPERRDESDHQRHNYVRPLLTIGPTAVHFHLPINTDINFADITGLEKELNDTNYWNKTILVVWEHAKLDEFAKKMVEDHHGNADTVPPWPQDKQHEYDLILIIKIVRSKNHDSADCTVDYEGLTK